MNQRDTKRDMCAVVARLIDSYMQVGQPWEEHGCADDSCPECRRKVKALNELMDEMDRRSLLRPALDTTDPLPTTPEGQER